MPTPASSRPRNPKLLNNTTLKRSMANASSTISSTVFTRSGSAQVVKDADDLQLDGWSTSPAGDQFFNGNPLRKRIDTGEKALDKTFVDHRDPCAAGGVVVIDAPTFDHTNSQGIEVSRCHHLKSRSRTFGRIGHGLAHN